MAEQQAKPIIAVTIGDPAGVGPETVVKAVATGVVQQACLPLIFGDLAVLDRAVQVTGVDLAFRSIESPQEVAEQDALAVVDLHAGGENAPIGKISREGGLAAFSAIERAVATVCMGRRSQWRPHRSTRKVCARPVCPIWTIPRYSKV